MPPVWQKFNRQIDSLSQIFNFIVHLPSLTIVVFRRSENTLRHCLGIGFDTDQELLEMLTSGRLLETPVGAYLQSLQDKFDPEVAVDIICYLHIHVKLSIEAKGILLMRKSGFELPPGLGVQEKFAEPVRSRKTSARPANSPFRLFYTRAEENSGSSLC